MYNLGECCSLHVGVSYCLKELYKKEYIERMLTIDITIKSNIYYDEYQEDEKNISDVKKR